LNKIRKKTNSPFVSLLIPHEQVQNGRPSTAMILEDGIVRRQVVQQHHETLFALLMKLNGDLRRMLSQSSGIPGEHEFIRALYFQVLTGVNKDTSIFSPHIDPKSSPNDGVQFDVNDIGVTRTHPAPQAFWIKPHVEDLFA
jgi:hypothetical protein